MDPKNRILNSKYYKQFASSLVGMPNKKEDIKEKVLAILLRELLELIISKLDEQTLSELEKALETNSEIKEVLTNSLKKIENIKFDDIFKEFEEGRMKELINKFSSK